jgi:ankyrin repeat protein
MPIICHKSGPRWLAIAAVVVFSAGRLFAASDTRVVQAIRQNDIAAARAALKRGADVNGRLGDGSTALHWAVHRGDLDAVNLLIATGAAANVANDLGVTPLWVACDTGSSDIVSALLLAGADPNLGPSTGGTCLIRAVHRGNAAIAKLLLAHRAEVNAREQSRGQTALMWAAGGQQAELVRVLVETGAEVNARSWSQTRLVVECCMEKNLGALGDALEVANGGLTPLMYAARAGAVESGRILIGAQAVVDELAPNGATALAIASLAGQSAFVTMLLEHGADPNLAGAGFTALHAAVARGDIALVRQLLAHGADINARLVHGTPARRIESGPVDVALDKRMAGATPFVMAAGLLEVEIMRQLAASGADTRLAMKDGTTALIAAGAKLDNGAGAQGGVNPFAKPAAKREGLVLEAMNVALALHADPNEVNQAGDTALHGAATQGFDSVIQLLAEHGAKMNPKNRNNQTPLAIVLAGPPPPKGAFGLDEYLAQVEREKVQRARTAGLLRQLGATE